MHGALTTISLVKRGRRSIFYNGTLADRTSSVRLIGFNSVHQRQLQDLHEQRLLVELVDCEVKQSRYGDGFEVVIKTTSEVRRSARSINVENIMAENEVQTNLK